MNDEYFPQWLKIEVHVRRPGWHAQVTLDNGTQAEMTGGTIHSAVTKALGELGQVCPAHVQAARANCDALGDVIHVP